MANKGKLHSEKKMLNNQLKEHFNRRNQKVVTLQRKKERRQKNQGMELDEVFHVYNEDLVDSVRSPGDMSHWLKSVAEKVTQKISSALSEMKKSSPLTPGLAIILIGNRKDSATYLWDEKKACEKVGINCFQVHLAYDASEDQVLNVISKFKDDPSVHAVLLPLPLPSHLSEQKIVDAVTIEKYVPHIAKGCMELMTLHGYGVNIQGKRIVVVGQSNYIGMPNTLSLQMEDTTVSIIHSRTSNPEEITREADVIICAVGQPNMVRQSWIKPCAVAIDIGINPGGLGSLTVALILSNILDAAMNFGDV